MNTPTLIGRFKDGSGAVVSEVPSGEAVTLELYYDDPSYSDNIHSITTTVDDDPNTLTEWMTGGETLAIASGGTATKNLESGRYNLQLGAMRVKVTDSRGTWDMPPLSLTAPTTAAHSATFDVTYGETASAGAAVTVLNSKQEQVASGQTDAAGQFTADLLDGTYSYTVALGSVSATGTFTISGGAQSIPVELPVAFVINVASGCISSSMVGAIVTVHGGGKTYGPVTTDADGQAVFQLPSGSYTYDVSAPNYISITESAFTVLSEGSITATLEAVLCLESLALYEGTHPDGVSTTTATIGGTYYLEAIYKGTPPADSQIGFIVALLDPQYSTYNDTLIGTATISGNKAHITWDSATTNLGPATNYIFYLNPGGVNAHLVYLDSVTVEYGPQ